MKTSKETQLEILDKMKENIINEKDLLEGVQFKNHVTGLWDDQIYNLSSRHFESLELRIKPTSTITVNGVEIPKPLEKEVIIDSNDYFYVCADKYLYDSNSGKYIKDYDVNFVYETQEEAIQASKLLFGLGD